MAQISFGMVEMLCPVDDMQSKQEFKKHVTDALADGYMPAGPMTVLIVGTTPSSEEGNLERVPLMYYCFPVLRAQGPGLPGSKIQVAGPGMRVQ